MRFTSFSYALVLTEEQEQALRRHAGAARFAYNQGLALLNAAYQAHKTDPAVPVPYTGFDLINTFNRWKVSPAAGTDAAGKPGLPWRQEVLAQVFEEALVDLGRGLKAFFDGRKSPGKGRQRGFPRFKKRGRSKAAFRLRNKRDCIRVGLHSIHLPKLGELRVRESTRRLRRLLRAAPEQPARAKVLFATVSETAGRWFVRLNVEAAPFHPAMRHASSNTGPAVGIDRGLHAFAVAATASGQELWRSTAPKPLRAQLRALRRLSRCYSRSQKDSRNRQRLRPRLARLHARIANIRRDHVHKLSTAVAKTHAHVAVEDLHISGMLRNHALARSISDVAWGAFANQLRYKAGWYGARLTLVDRFYPSSKTCHRCQAVLPTLRLADRTFACPACGLTADRDTNAAANCARFAEQQDTVAAKHAETQNACRGEGSGRVCMDATKPAPMKQERLSILTDLRA